MDMTEHSILSKREMEILELVATGLTNREIAQELHISPNTVKVHLSNIFEKTGVTSRTEAALYGIEHGLVSVPGGGKTASDKPVWREVINTYRWVWMAILLLLATFFAALSTNLFFRGSNAESPDGADVGESWQELAPMPEARRGMAVVAYDQNLYAIAGEGLKGVSGAVFSYSTAEEAWTRLSSKPTPVTDVHGVLIGEKIYIPGGRTSAGAPSDVLEIYDPRRDIWEAGAPLPAAVSAYALVDFEGEIYLFGGWDGNGASKAVFIYDPVSDSWETGTPMLVSAYELGAAELTDKIVVMGGRNADGALDSAEAYYPSRDANGEYPWETFVDMPMSRYGFGVASIYDTLYVIGGTGDDEESESGSGIVFSQGSWDDLHTIGVFRNLNPRLVTSGSLMYLLIPLENLAETALWQYKAIFYEIYIPFIP